MKQFFAYFAAVAVLAGPLFAQAPSPPPSPPPTAPAAAAQASDAAKPAAAVPIEFEAADVHHTPPYRIPFYYGAVARSDRYILKQATMKHLIATAYNLDQPAAVGGGPSWVGWNRFDIVAKIQPGTTAAEARPMLQNLLAERFKLVVHPGDVPVPGYLLALANGKPGPNLKPSASGEEGTCKNNFTPPSGPGSIPSISLECHGATIATLTSTLMDMRGGGYVDYNKPIVDATGLKGTYDFNLKWTPSFFLPHSGGAGISLYQALEQQLGIELLLKTVPRPGIVIDSVNEEPTPNAPDLAKIMPPLPPPQFDVATIKPAQPGERGMFKTTGDELTIQGIPLKFLIAIAWDLDFRNSDMLDAPKWIDSAKLDIDGKTADKNMGVYSSGRSQQVYFEDYRQMLRALLIDRFNIKYHMEDRPTDSYTLEVSDPKLASLKLAKAAPSEFTGCGTQPGPDGKDPRMENIVLNSLQSCSNTTMDEFAGELQSIAPDYFFFPVKNDTGLKGAFDFTMSWSSADLALGTGMGPVPAPAAEGAPAAGDPNGAVSFFDAIKKELGLKVIKEKRPEPVLVIDHIDEQPAEN